MGACRGVDGRDSEAGSSPTAWLRDAVAAAAGGGNLGLEAVFIVGSRAGGGVETVTSERGDIDLLCLATAVDKLLFKALTASIRTFAPPGPALRIETRIGPVPASAGAGLAVHLLVHDRASWRATSPVSRSLCMAFGRPILGRPPGDPFAPPGPPPSIRGFLLRDLARLDEALSRCAAPIRRWRFHPQARLVEAWVKAVAPPARDKLCRHAASLLRGWALLLPLWDAHPARRGEADELARIAALAAAGERVAAHGALVALRRGLAQSETRP